MKRDSLRIITNFNCNQRCIFCYQKRWDNNFICLQDIEKQLKANDTSLETLYNTFNNISIMGGEPLLNPHLPELLAGLKKEFMDKTINLDTNAKLLLKEGYIKYNFIDKINRLSIDFGYPQTNCKEKDYQLMKQKIELMKTLLEKYTYLTIKCNHVFSEKNVTTIKEIFEYFLKLLTPLYKQYKNRILITVCEDVIKLNPNIHLKTFMDKFSANYVRFIEESKIHILEINKINIGYFGLDDFADTDLIIWKDGYTTSFVDYLHMINPTFNCNRG